MSGLSIGVGKVDITPPVGTPLCGALEPRESVGVQDPLYAKTIVLEGPTTSLAYVVLDLIGLDRKLAERALALAAERTGIPADRIVWAASHTHTGPYVGRGFARADEGFVNQEWRATLPERIAESVARASERKVPARVSRVRAFHHGLSQNRRTRLKDGREVNNWLLRNVEDVQCVATAGPVDPEILVLAFEDEAGRLLAVLFQFALHTNANFGKHLSADYPAVVGERIAEALGDAVETLFVPGASGDLNKVALSYLEIGDALAGRIIPALESRVPAEGPVELGVMKREVAVPHRDCSVEQDSRIRAAGWSHQEELFRREAEIVRAEGVREIRTVLQAWRVGDVGFASLPGEPFVEWGAKIKQESPFPWTFPVGYAGDRLGYLVTHGAWEAGGYESLIHHAGRVHPDGVARMVDEALGMLGELYRN